MLIHFAFRLQLGGVVFCRYNVQEIAHSKRMLTLPRDDVLNVPLSFVVSQPEQFDRRAPKHLFPDGPLSEPP